MIKVCAFLAGLAWTAIHGELFPQMPGLMSHQPQAWQAQPRHWHDWAAKPVPDWSERSRAQRQHEWNGGYWNGEPSGQWWADARD